MDQDPIAQRLSAAYHELPAGEQAVIRVLLDDWPFAALGSLRALAERAGVSPPTASRLFERLKFGGFAGFQNAVRDGARDRSRLLEHVTATLDPRTSSDAQESDASHDSPDHRGDADSRSDGKSRGSRADAPKTPPVASAKVRQAVDELRAGFNGNLDAVTEEHYHSAAALLAPARTVWALGGPLSELAAEYLVRQLASLRPGAHRVPDSAHARARTVLDLGPSDVVVAYDFRRYSPGTAAFVQAARARRARLVLVTDAWASPLADQATVLIRLPAAGPMAPLAHEIAITELILVATAARLTPAQRLADLDDLTQTL